MTIAQQEFEKFRSLEGWKAAVSRVAFEMKKSTGEQLGHCHQKLAKEQGYTTFAAWQAAAKEFFLKR